MEILNHGNIAIWQHGKIHGGIKIWQHGKIRGEIEIWQPWKYWKVELRKYVNMATWEIG